jgi:thiamine-monophosphate kinase
MRERERIARFFAPLSESEPGAFALTDDAALLDLPAGKKLIVTTDSVIEGTHLPSGSTPTQFAQKLVRRNLSDLASMGAVPWRYLLNLHTPRDLPDAWLAEFSAVLKAEQELFDMALAGGDTTTGEGPIHLTLTCLGLTEGAVLRRAGARQGDTVFVSGTIGDAALGLQCLQGALNTEETRRAFLLGRYYRPEPRLALGQALLPLASAAIDISDGLLLDAARLAAASGVGILIERGKTPLSAAAAAILGNQPHSWETILGGGDDYELLFTAPDIATGNLAALAEKLAIAITPIGRVTGESGVRLAGEQGQPLNSLNPGWEY